MTPESPITSSSYLKPLLLVTVVLILPLVLLAIYGEFFQSIADEWQADPPPRWVMALAVIAILASDVFLPVPSSPISTLAGSQLGFLLGTTASMIGMTVGAAIAFALARKWGKPLASRYTSPERLAELEASCAQQGVWMLIISRPLPILAEACALLVGTLQMPWRSFLPTVLITNLLIAATYSALGEQAKEYGWLPIALCASIAVPLLVSWLYRLRLQKSTNHD